MQYDVDNINLYKVIIIAIRDILIQILIDKIKEMLKPLIENIAIELTKERFSMYRKQIDNIRELIENAVNAVTDLSNKGGDAVDSVTDKAEIITSKTT